jgi:lysophospholipase L1-like esterase
MKRALVVVFASFIPLVICELGLRLFWHNPYRYEAPDHLLKIYTHHANTDYFTTSPEPKNAHKRGRLRTDARSYILPSFQYRHPDVTIGFLGGSTTECVVVQEDLRFPALVSKLLADRDVKANTLNSGRSGNSLHDSLNILLNHMIEDHPDIVVLMHAANDAGVLTRDGGYDSRMGHPVSISDLGKWSLQMVSSNLSLAGRVRAWDPTVSLGAIPADILRPKTTGAETQAKPVSMKPELVDVYRKRLQAFIHMSRAFGIQPVIMTEPFSGSTNALTPDWVKAEPLDELNAVIREVGEREGVPVIDLVRYLQENVPGWAKPMNVFYDGIHVTDQGSRVYAEYITERLVPLIVKKTLEP